ncbi:hypothetical protein SAMN04488700_1671 [Carnobacterium iners]|uniref:Pilus assembly protein, PilO n=1 Tax=Carnobacterium iners TaxID=1073423 RepID=A0A1X7NC35_9LACT|nr:hypothetical protein [Carnobacterium iners]SEK50968.1 hypothetical protein SAMN04488114_10533 [Carnobacterium iners]SMH34512.1 hypothetical protein SAMN04488700_1671 [Carnobacterium iners]
MKLKWNRVSSVLALVIGLVILGVFILGQAYFLDPIKERANLSDQQVEELTSLKTEYPPEASLLSDFKQEYEETWKFLPESERVNEELVVLEKLATQEKVAIQQILRVGEPVTIEDLDESYRKSIYEVEMTSTTAGNMQDLVEKLEALERIWNIQYFGFEKLDEASFSGTFTFELFYYVVASE